MFVAVAKVFVTGFQHDEICVAFKVGWWLSGPYVDWLRRLTDEVKRAG